MGNNVNMGFDYNSGDVKPAIGLNMLSDLLEVNNVTGEQFELLLYDTETFEGVLGQEQIKKMKPTFYQGKEKGSLMVKLENPPDKKSKGKTYNLLQLERSKDKTVKIRRPEHLDVISRLRLPRRDPEGNFVRDQSGNLVFDECDISHIEQDTMTNQEYERFFSATCEAFGIQARAFQNKDQAKPLTEREVADITRLDLPVRQPEEVKKKEDTTKKVDELRHQSLLNSISKDMDRIGETEEQKRKNEQKAQQRKELKRQEILNNDRLRKEEDNEKIKNEYVESQSIEEQNN